MTKWMILLLAVLCLAALGCDRGGKDAAVNSGKNVPRTTSAE